MSRLEQSNPFRVFLNKSFSVKATHSDPFTCVLPDLLHPKMGTLIETAQVLIFKVECSRIVSQLNLMHAEKT